MKRPWNFSLFCLTFDLRKVYHEKMEQNKRRIAGVLSLETVLQKRQPRSFEEEETP